LVEELGIQPGEELRELERKVLTQDPQLRAQAPHGAARATQGLDPPPAPRRWRPATIAALALVITAVAIASALVETGSTPAHDPAARAKSLAVLDARSGKLVAQVPMPPDQNNVKGGAGAFWTLGDSGVLVQVDARTLRVLRSVPLGLSGGDIAVGEGAAWVSGKSPTLARIDPRYGTVTRFGLPRAAKIAAGDPDGAVPVGHDAGVRDREGPLDATGTRAYAQ
jgi:streptogramin lyase